MNGFLDRFHNFILTFVRGVDGICACTCGRNQDYHVLPYYKAHTMVNSRDHYYINDVMTKQEIDVMVGLLMGLCISHFLIWLHHVHWTSWFTYWTPNQLQNLGFRSWIVNFRDSFRRSCATISQDMQTTTADKALPDLNGHGNMKR